jgi:hypothetical protein
VIVADISTESLDTANLEPMVEAALEALEAAGVTDKPGLVLADAGYWKNDAIEAIVNRGIQTLVAPDGDSRKEPRPGRRGGVYDFVRRVLGTDWGKQLYLRRQGSVEPVFGQIKSNRGVRRFQRGGRLAVLPSKKNAGVRSSPAAHVTARHPLLVRARAKGLCRRPSQDRGVAPLLARIRRLRGIPYQSTAKTSPVRAVVTTAAAAS